MATQADFAEMLQKSEQLNLKYKTKIIEIQNQLDFERSKANEYEAQFRDVVLQSNYSSDQELLQKLTNKENQLNECRKQVIELNRRLTNSNNSPAQADLLALARQNEELMSNIDQIKNAAISAIMIKEEEIQELNKTISRYQLMENELKFQYDKYESLERDFDLTLREKEEEVKQLNQKITRERQAFFNKLEAFQSEASQEENFRQIMLEKAQDLEGNLEKSQMLLSDYEKKVYELEGFINQQKFSSEQQRYKTSIEIQELKENIKNYQKQEKTLTKLLEQLKNRQKNSKQQISKLHELNEEITRKLSIKKKKQNKAVRDKISSSFSGVVKANPVYASFAFRAKDSIFEQEQNPKHLGQIPEMQQLDGMIQNFTFDQLGGGNAQVVEVQTRAQRPFQKKDIPISQMMIKKKEKQGEAASTTTTNVTITENPANKNCEAQSIVLSKQIQNYKQSVIRLQAEKKQLQDNLNSLYNQMQHINQSLVNITNQLQQERKNTAQLRNQMKKTKKQSELIVEVQSLILHVEKLQKDMITSKLKYAQQADYVRQKYNRQKVMWTQKLVQLTQKIAKQDLQLSSTKQVKTQQKKKKRGFFG